MSGLVKLGSVGLRMATDSLGKASLSGVFSGFASGASKVTNSVVASKGAGVAMRGITTAARISKSDMSRSLISEHVLPVIAKRGAGTVMNALDNKMERRELEKRQPNQEVLSENLEHQEDDVE